MTGSGNFWGSFTIGSGSTLNITAPTTATNGDNQGMALWMDKNMPTNTSSDTVSSSSTVNLNGVLYAPTQNVTWSGNSGTTATCSQIVAKTITFTGGGTFSHNCSSAGISEAVVNATLTE
jgi:hypothetical protein